MHIGLLSQITGLPIEPHVAMHNRFEGYSKRSRDGADTFSYDENPLQHHMGWEARLSHMEYF